MSKQTDSLEQDAEQWVQIERTAEDDVAVANVRDEHELEIDEPSWLSIGDDSAPWPSNYLLVACAGCQVEVITQAFEKGRIDDYEIDVTASYEVEDLGHELDDYPDHLSMRYATIKLDIDIETDEANEEKVQRLLDIAEDACIVSRSVERGVDFDISKNLSVRSGE